MLLFKPYVIHTSFFYHLIIASSNFIFFACLFKIVSAVLHCTVNDMVIFHTVFSSHPILNLFHHMGLSRAFARFKLCNEMHIYRILVVYCIHCSYSMYILHLIIHQIEYKAVHFVSTLSFIYSHKYCLFCDIC